MSAEPAQTRTRVSLVASLEVTDRVLLALRTEPQSPALADLAMKVASQRGELLAQLNGSESETSAAGLSHHQEPRHRAEG